MTDYEAIIMKFKIMNISGYKRPRMYEPKGIFRCPIPKYSSHAEGLVQAHKGCIVAQRTAREPLMNSQYVKRFMYYILYNTII